MDAKTENGAPATVQIMNILGKDLQKKAFCFDFYSEVPFQSSTN